MGQKIGQGEGDRFLMDKVLFHDIKISMWEIEEVFLRFEGSRTEDTTHNSNRFYSSQCTSPQPLRWDIYYLTLHRLVNPHSWGTTLFSNWCRSIRHATCRPFPVYSACLLQLRMPLAKYIYRSCNLRSWPLVGSNVMWEILPRVILSQRLVFFGMFWRSTVIDHRLSLSMVPVIDWSPAELLSQRNSQAG